MPYGRLSSSFWNIEDAAAGDGQPPGEGEVIPRQQRRARNLQARAAALRRARAAATGQENGEEGEGILEEVDLWVFKYGTFTVGGDDDDEFQFQKIGTKKLRKIKEKAERKAMREVRFLMCSYVSSCVTQYISTIA